ncbi:hypothetical protein RQP46_004669 [Phenoliferia psychrophenolica]
MTCAGSATQARISPPLPRKFGKAKRGGGRHFSRDLSRLDPEGNPEGKGSDDSSSEEESSDDEDDATDPSSRLGQLPPVAGSDDEQDDPAASSGLAKNLNSQLSLAPAVGPDGEVVVQRTGQKLTPDQVAEARKARKAAAGKGKPAGAGGDGSESEEEENENKKGGKAIKMADLNAPREMSRREKEQADKAAAKERYAKLHAAGKTDEAKSDLGRLAEIRKQREQAAARRKAETDAKDDAAKLTADKTVKKPEIVRKAPGAGRRAK